MDNNSIIIVEQLPVITERLKTISDEIDVKINAALALECTEETVKEIKKLRAELNNDFKNIEERRKEVKKAVLSPYEQFEEIYKEYITNKYNKADSELKAQINSVEDELKNKKEEEVKQYFSEYAESLNIDIVKFSDSKINITLSASLKSLKEQAKSFLDRINDDLALIETQEHKAEIFVEYKVTLNAAKAINLVAARHKAIEEQKAQQEERKAKEQVTKERINKVVSIMPSVITSPIVEEIKEQEKILSMTFTVKGTLEQLRELKNHLIEKGLYNEQHSGSTKA